MLILHVSTFDVKRFHRTFTHVIKTYNNIKKRLINNHYIKNLPSNTGSYIRSDRR